MSTTTLATPAYLTTADLAERLRRSQQTIRFWVAEEGLPARRVKRRLYFDSTEVDAWLRARSDDADHPGDAYRDHIKRLVDAAPPLTAEQADRIKAVLNSGTS